MVNTLAKNRSDILCIFLETEEEKIKDKLKIEFDDNKCVTRRDLSLEGFENFITQFARK